MTEGILAFVLSLLFVTLVRWDALRRGVIDAPTARSSHSRPTPRGGGLGLLIALALTLFSEFGLPGTLAGWAPIVAVALVANVGWLDDHRGAPVRLRLAVHLSAGLLILPLAQSASYGLPSAAPFGWLVATGLGAWWVFWTISSINVVNFIDGIDGLIGAQMLVFGLHLVRLGEVGGGARAFGLVLVGASVGFLVWNWNPARIFLGDVGSGALGVVLVIGGLLLLREGRVGFISTFVPFTPIFLDAALTLLRRARRGERLSQPHRSHLYQRLANGRYGHAPVAVAYTAASLGASVIGGAMPQQGALVLVAALAALGMVGRFAESVAEPFPPRAG